MTRAFVLLASLVLALLAVPAANAFQAVSWGDVDPAQQCEASAANLLLPGIDAPAGDCVALAPIEQFCSVVGLSGTPPQPVINWECLHTS